VIEKNAIVEDNYTIVRKGVEHTMADVKFPVRDHSGEIIAVGGIELDITDLKQAEQAVREKSEFLQLTQVITRAANEAVSVETVMKLALDQVCAHTGWSVGHLYTRDEATGNLAPGGIWHIEDADKFSTFRRVTEATRSPTGASLSGRVLTSGNPTWIEDITTDPNFPRAQLAIELGVRGAFAFPVLIGREIAAVLEFFSEDTAEPYQPLLEVMAQIGTQLGRVIERKRAAERASAEIFRIEEELQSARELQSAMLPRHFPPPTPQRPVECTAMMQPAKEVGGDFYDVIELDEKRLGIVIADVAGKGAGAALFMARAFTILDAAARSGGRPGEVLSHLNDLLCVSNDKVIFVTVFYGVFDSSTTTLTFANAGHNPPILIRSDRRVEPLQLTGGVAVGVKPNLEYRERSVEIGPGDTVFCYTDGFTEAKNPANQEFSVTNLEKVLADCAQVPVRDIPGRVIEGVNEFTENAPPFDDMTCVVMRHIMAQHA
jgi:serine phosphatase RsbU (regulator of sigma subunit)